MADYAVISDVSTSLVTLLDQELRKPPLNARALLDDLSGTAPAALTLTVTLYEILEDAPSRNRPRPQQPAGTAVISTKPPMALRLHYLLTPWGGDSGYRAADPGAGHAGALRRRDPRAGPTLLGGLQGSADTLKITLIPLTLEDRSRVWYAIQKSYRLSVNYEVRVVNLDATAELRDEVVQSRALDAEPDGEPAMSAAVHPPAARRTPGQLQRGLVRARRPGHRLAAEPARCGFSWTSTTARGGCSPASSRPSRSAARSAIPIWAAAANPAAAAPRRYRARFESDVYLAVSRAHRDGEEFLAYPFDDTTPPAVAASRVTVSLAPAAGYPFPGDLPVLYGQVSTAAGEPVPDVLLSATVGPPVLRMSQTAQTLTGPGGTFALPLRWAPVGQIITVTATDYRHTPNRTGQLIGPAARRTRAQPEDRDRVTARSEQMPQYLSPGVYIEELDVGPHPIQGVSTSTTGMVGVTARGPTDGKPRLVTTFNDYQRIFGGFLPVPDDPGVRSTWARSTWKAEPGGCSPWRSRASSTTAASCCT